MAVTLRPKCEHDVLCIAERDSVFVCLPDAAGILAGLLLVQLLERGVERIWLVGTGFVLLGVSFVGMALTVPFAEALERLNLFGVFDPGPIGDTSARIVITIVFSTASAFSFSIVGVASRSLVNARMPQEIQGRVFAAQVVLTNLASIPPILLAGVLSPLVGVEPLMFLPVFILAVPALGALAGPLARPRVSNDAEAA